MLDNCPKYEVEKLIEVDSITSIHYFEFDDSFVDIPEAHEPWELVYVDRGECSILADGTEFSLMQGQMYFHKPYENHMLKVQKGNTPNIFIMVFSSRSQAMGYFENRKLDASITTKQHIAAILHEAGATFDLPFNDPRMQRLCPKKNNILWGGQQTVLLRLELMLIEMVRSEPALHNAHKRFFPKDIIRDEFALQVIDFMESRLYGKFTMEELSRELSFGKTYISKYFTKVCGYSIIEYFNRMKINEAKRLIRESRYNFFEISEMLMLSNSHYFSTLFKRYTGMTPSQYKKSCKSN